jgi:AsmA protein
MKPGFRHGLIGAAGVLALGLALPLLVPASLYKSEIEQSVTRVMGRNFTISGPLHFTLFPTFGLHADNIALANMPGGQAPSMVRTAGVRVGIRLLPLFSGHIEVSQILLDRPDIVLEVDKEGRANWTFERLARSAKNVRTPHLSIDAHFSGLNIVHGRVTYSNLRSGDTRKIDDLDAAIDLGELDRPAVIAGIFTSSQERIAFRAKVAASKVRWRPPDMRTEFSRSTPRLHGTQQYGWVPVSPATAGLQRWRCRAGS